MHPAVIDYLCEQGGAKLAAPQRRRV